jgi:S-adenosylmethionine:tRNA ribosyltransferase-isomerase
MSTIIPPHKTKPINPALRLTDFDFDLPEALIAQHPPAIRGESRLLRIEAQGMKDDHMQHFIDQLEAGDCLVLNDTKVIKARLFGEKETGGKIELLIERVINETTAWAHIKSSRSPKRARN